MNVELNILNVDQSNSNDAHIFFPLAFEAPSSSKVYVIPLSMAQTIKWNSNESANIDLCIITQGNILIMIF